jgi:DNA-binding response OmpR family regulator
MNILLVEDDPGIGRFVTKGLTAEGWHVHWLRQGETAVTTAGNGDYSAIILDLMLSDTDGYTLARQIRQAGISRPILMLTARDSLEEKLEGFRAGADDYVTKPFAFEELMARLKVLARRNAAPQQEQLVISVGDLVIDLLAHEVKMAGQAVELTKREYDLLLYLARCGGRAVSRERILQNAWGATIEVTPNAVDVYVGYIRKKLQALGPSPTIKTVRGVGFRLTE